MCVCVCVCISASQCVSTSDFVFCLLFSENHYHTHRSMLRGSKTMILHPGEMPSIYDCEHMRPFAENVTAQMWTNTQCV